MAGSMQRWMTTDAQEQEAGGLEAVYLAQRAALARFLRARGAGDLADDLVQELWLIVAALPPRPIADPVGYLYRAADNLMISRYRSAQRRDRRDDQWTNAALRDRRPGIDDSLAARQEIARAEQRLRAAGPRVLRAFLLFRVHGIAQRDIAAQLGVSISAVEKDLQRAYRAIAALKDEFDAE